MIGKIILIIILLIIFYKLLRKFVSKAIFWVTGVIFFLHNRFKKIFLEGGK